MRGPCTCKQGTITSTKRAGEQGPLSLIGCGSAGCCAAQTPLDPRAGTMAQAQSSAEEAHGLKEMLKGTTMAVYSRSNICTRSQRCLNRLSGFLKHRRLEKTFSISSIRSSAVSAFFSSVKVTRARFISLQSSSIPIMRPSRCFRRATSGRVGRPCGESNDSCVACAVAHTRVVLHNNT